MFQVEVMRSADVHRVNTWVGNGPFVRAEAAGGAELFGEGGRLHGVATGKIEVGIDLPVPYGPGEGASEGAATKNAKAESHTCLLLRCRTELLSRRFQAYGVICGQAS